MADYDIMTRTVQGQNGKNFANKNHLDGVENSGVLLSKNIKLCLLTKDERFHVIGGMNQFGIQCGNELIPLSEIGSDQWNIVAGKTVPVNMNCSRFFLNHQNFLSIVSDVKGDSASKEETEMVLDLTKKELSSARDYYMILEWEKKNSSTGEIETVKAEVKRIIGAVLTSYNMSFGSGIVVLEQAQLQAAGIDDGLK